MSNMCSLLQPVTDELVEFQKYLVHIQDFGKLTDPFRRMCRIFLDLIKTDVNM